MNQTSNDTLSALLIAVQVSSPSKVAQILTVQPGLATATVPAHPSENDPEGTTLLHWAMPGDARTLRDEHTEVARLLLDCGADPNTVGNGPNHGRCVPLSLAAWCNHVPLIELLLEYGADPNGSSSAYTPIRSAAEHNHVQAVEALVNAGAAHTLYELLLSGLENRISDHLDEKPQAIVELLDDDMPPLHAALSTAAGATLVPLLLERGAHEEARDGLGRTALHKAIDHEHAEAISILCGGNGVDIFAAAGLGDVARVDALLASESACALAAQADGTTPLFYAVLSSSVAIAEKLLDAGADPSPRSPRHWACITPLHLAIMRSNMPLVETLLSRSADLNAHTSPKSYSPTPMHIAARWGGRECIATLLQSGADPYAGGPVKTGSGPSVLSWVSYAGQIDHLELLIDAGVDVTDPRCGSILHTAAARGHTAFVDLLLKRGANPTAIDDQGKTPLVRAKEQGHNDTAGLLQASIDGGT